MSTIPLRAVGVVWFREEDYPAILRISEDAIKMNATWKEWLAGAEKSEQAAKVQGILTERVIIDPDTFPDWCKANGVGVNSEGRHKFVASIMAVKYRNQS